MQRNKTRPAISEWERVKAGVPQGSVLRLLLFIWIANRFYVSLELVPSNYMYQISGTNILPIVHMCTFLKNIWFVCSKEKSISFPNVDYDFVGISLKYQILVSYNLVSQSFLAVTCLMWRQNSKAENWLFSVTPPSHLYTETESMASKDFQIFRCTIYWLRRWMEMSWGYINCRCPKLPC